ncbi:MAG: hypothetical protein ACK43M_02425 [Allorhizobium sp.]
MSKTTNDLMVRTLELIKTRHGAWMANEPQTRVLIGTMIESGIADADDLVEMVELSGGKRYDPKTATFH